VLAMSNHSQKIRDLVNRLVAHAASVGRPMRPQQLEYMNHWLEATLESAERFTNGDVRTGIQLSSADTGLGKTMGYALPLFAVSSVTGHACAIATHSHMLQRQMMDGDIALLNSWMVEIGEKPLRVARRMGKQAFISKSRLAKMIAVLKNADKKTENDQEQLGWLEDVSAWMDAQNTGLIEDAIAACGDLPEGIARAAIALPIDASLAEKAAYLRNIADADASDITLVTHHYLSAKALYSATENRYAAIVIDEADLIVEVVDNMASHEMSLMAIKRLLVSVDANAEHMQIIERLIEFTSAQICNDAIATCLMPENSQTYLFAQATKLLAVIDSLIVKIKQAEYLRSGTDSDLQEDLMRAKKILMEFIKPNGFFVSALTFSPVRGHPSLVVMPVKPGALLRNLWRDSSGESKLFSVMFTSATLGTSNEPDPVRAFKHIAGQVGIYYQEMGSTDLDATDAEKIGKPQYQLPMTHHWCQYEPASFGKMHVVYPDPMVCSPVTGFDDDFCAVLSDDWVDYAAMMVRAAAKTIVNGNSRTLVLTRSYADCEALRAKLEGKIDDDKLVIQTRTSGGSSAKRKFLETDGAVWISPTSWEGLDLPNTIANLVLFRMPFKGPDALLKALLIGVSKKTEASADKIVADRSVTLAKRLLRQGLGRPIRTATDECIVWVADTRIRVPQNNSNLIVRATGREGRYLTKKMPDVITPKNFNWILKTIPKRFENDWNRTKNSPTIFWADKAEKMFDNKRI
jgi:Rad3-related DNA helicase